MNIFLVLFIGFCAGLFSGFFGVGGGVILVPALVLLLGLTQHQAQGTSLAVFLLPIFVLAVWKYYQQGNVNVPLAFQLAGGFLLGGLLGATLAHLVQEQHLKAAFAVLLIVMAVKILLGK